MFAQGCVCECVFLYSRGEQEGVCVCFRERRMRGGNILAGQTCRSSVFNMVSEHKCSNSDMMGAAYVHCAAH